MKRVVLIFLCFFPLSSNVLGNELDLIVNEESLTNLPKQRGKLLSVACRFPDGQYINRLLIWIDDDKGRISLETLSGFNEVAQLHVNEIGKDKSQDMLPLIIGRMTSKYILNPGELNLDEERLKRFSTELKANINVDRYNNIISKLNPSHAEITESSWEITMYVLTELGSLEKRKISGQLNPFAVSKVEVMILFPSGSIPDFGFLP